MGRYIVRFRGPGAKPADALERILHIVGARVLDDSPRMMLIEAVDDAPLRSALDARTWQITEEKSYELPTPRVKVAR